MMALAPSGRPIFIVGCQRSGTTLLRAMLASHSSIAIPYEAHRFSTLLSVPHPWTHVWPPEQRLQVIAEFLSQPKPSQWGVTPEEVAGAWESSGPFRFADVIRAMYRAYARKEGKPRWGDKTPSNTFELPHVVREFPDAQFVHIIRDGRDVYLSWLKVEWAQNGVARGARKWAEWVQAASDPTLGLTPDRYLELTYEELVRKPEETLRRVCAFLHEPFEESMLHYYAGGKSYVPQARQHIHRLLASPPDPSRVGAWRGQMARQEVRRFERVAGATLLRYGYPVALRSRVVMSVDAAVRTGKRFIKSAFQIGTMVTQGDRVASR